MECQKSLWMAKSGKIPITSSFEKGGGKMTTIQWGLHACQRAAWWLVTYTHFSVKTVFLLWLKLGKCKAQELQSKFNLHSTLEKVRNHSCGALLKVIFWIVHCNGGERGKWGALKKRGGAGNICTSKWCFNKIPLMLWSSSFASGLIK